MISPEGAKRLFDVVQAGKSGAGSRVGRHAVRRARAARAAGTLGPATVPSPARRQQARWASRAPAQRTRTARNRSYTPPPTSVRATRAPVTPVAAPPKSDWSNRKKMLYGAGGAAAVGIIASSNSRSGDPAAGSTGGMYGYGGPRQPMM